MHEVLFLVGRDDAVLWADWSTSAVVLPDSRARWEKIWAQRTELVEIAHTHPVGPLGFSHEDETTMSALESALARPIRFSVVAPDGIVVRQDGRDVRVEKEPWWTSILRTLSGMERHEEV
jgi:hypothetical protein